MASAEDTPDGLIKRIQKLTAEYDKFKRHSELSRPFVMMTSHENGRNKVRHPIIDYGSMTHKEVIRLLPPAKPDVRKEFLGMLESRLKNFCPILMKWLEMESYKLKMKPEPMVRFMIGCLESMLDLQSYVVYYAKKLKPADQLIIFTTRRGSYIDIRDALAVDIIDETMTEKQGYDIINNFSNGEIQILFISNEIKCKLDFDSYMLRNVRYIVIEDIAKLLTTRVFNNIKSAYDKPTWFMPKRHVYIVTMMFPNNSSHMAAKKQIEDRMQDLLLDYKLNELLKKTQKTVEVKESDKVRLDRNGLLLKKK